MIALARRMSTSPGNAGPLELSSLRAALLEQYRFRTEQLDELAACSANGSALGTDDPRDEVTDALRAGAVSALREIDFALERIELGCYGACEACQRPIPVERLEILPMAALCMSCQHAREARAR